MYVPFLTKRRGGGASAGGGRSSGSSSGGQERLLVVILQREKRFFVEWREGRLIFKQREERIRVVVSGKSRSASTSSFGGGKPFMIPSGQLFAGRSAGGGTRGQVFGTRAYGSGYPGVYSRGVGGRGFPFYFWPLAWGTSAGLGFGAGAAYMHTDEYGEPTNSSRPGGVMASLPFTSNSSSSTFHLVADNTTLSSLLAPITTNCSSFLASPSANTTLSPFNSSALFPEQVVQYFRASSVALTLDGYNNSAVFAAENSTSDTALPAGTDLALLACLNATIGQAVPLVSGAESQARMGMLWVVVLVAVVRVFGL
ncbi:hypothetical protein MIND_01425500 [Mycena indigotica]|uniref:Uncharacterized protein n=1 Tax=Mycena indigotica TaxID=2126181 RepID=A0A8H6RWG4_9AGAR|nr:uncharacterized protein MIND_01425500 [Mycena indigotica]KAF7288589.1 hypothetical protein MIND_01425500 [Mycena indigotica]